MNETLVRKAKFIPGTEGYNKATPDGRVLSCRKWGTRVKDEKGEWHELTRQMVRGYPAVWLKIDGKWRMMKVHLLVLRAFVGPRPKGMWGRHYPDRTTTNCAIWNLSWADRRTNILDKQKHGTMASGEKHGRAKLTWEKVRRMRRMYKTGKHSLLKLGNLFGVSNNTTHAIVRNEIWREK